LRPIRPPFPPFKGASCEMAGWQFCGNHDFPGVGTDDMQYFVVMID
jgi:hypothetical protein